MRLRPSFYSASLVLVGFMAGIISILVGQSIWPLRSEPVPVQIQVAPGENWASAWDVEQGTALHNFAYSSYGVTFSHSFTGGYSEYPVQVYLWNNKTVTGAILSNGSAVVIRHDNGLIKSTLLCPKKPSILD